MPGDSEWTDIPLQPIHQTDHGTFSQPATQTYKNLREYENRMNEILDRPARPARGSHFPEELPPRPSPAAKAIRRSKVVMLLCSFFLFAGLATMAIVLGIMLKVTRADLANTQEQNAVLLKEFKNGNVTGVPTITMHHTMTSTTTVTSTKMVTTTATDTETFSFPFLQYVTQTVAATSTA
jgi:hypothetical protein